jgi:hypothetical protein
VSDIAIEIAERCDRGTAALDCDCVCCRAHDEIQRLRDFAKAFTRCPCCEREDECDEECTLRNDLERVGDLDQWERMQAARWALKGGGA